MAPLMLAPCGGGGGMRGLEREQHEVLKRLVAKHISDPALSLDAGVDSAVASDFTKTATERGLDRWEQAHLVTALDTLNAYQTDRLARLGCGAAAGSGSRPGFRRQYAADPRTRFVELLKRWLRTRAACEDVPEEELRGMCGLCREVLYHAEAFPSRNPRSFILTISEVYDHLQTQLGELLARDRSCAEVTARALSLGKNLVSDLVGYLLVGPTCFRQTDALASLEVVALWQSLPNGEPSVPGRPDAARQKQMRDVWPTLSGAALESLLRSPGCARLFDGAGNEAAAEAGKADVVSAERNVADFERLDLRASGLAGAFRKPEHRATRRRYVDSLRGVSDVVYLLGEALTKFHRIGDCLGDYGMIRAGPWLHPLLDALVQCLKRLRGDLEELNGAVEEAFVLSRARGDAVNRLAPSSRMCERAHAAWERAVAGPGAHLGALQRALEELRGRSSAERLPEVLAGMNEACRALQGLIKSPAFVARVGDLSAALGGGPEYMDDCRTMRPLRALGDSADHPGDGDASTTPGSGSDASRDAAVGVSDGDRSTADDELLLEVLRMAPLGSCDQRGDKRSLAVSPGRLQIFARASRSRVKTVVDLASDVEECRWESDSVVSLVIRRVPHGAQLEDGVVDYKLYRFRFASPAAAAAFQQKAWGPVAETS